MASIGKHLVDVCSIYALNPRARPEMHRIICIMLGKGPLTDNQLRALISQHIDTADVPQCAQDDVRMLTVNFAFRHHTDVLPELLRQLMDFCSRPSAIRFDEPIIDGTGASIGFLVLSHVNWQQTLDVTMALAHRIDEDAADHRECWIIPA
jgi:hypothetical protein